MRKSRICVALYLYFNAVATDLSSAVLYIIPGSIPHIRSTIGGNLRFLAEVSNLDPVNCSNKQLKDKLDSRQDLSPEQKWTIDELCYLLNFYHGLKHDGTLDHLHTDEQAGRDEIIESLCIK